jgi:hypothetical protein
MKTDSKGFLQLNTFPNILQIHSDPPMYYVKNFLSMNECKMLISISEKKSKNFSRC